MQNSTPYLLDTIAWITVLRMEISAITGKIPKFNVKLLCSLGSMYI
jgi:hypothetical protein